ncbi:MAG: hypothetical protein ACOX83_11805 [Candidatus Spyradocola sp.]|jgi:peptidoglycan hydrolase CwlO-like protein
MPGEQVVSYIIAIVGCLVGLAGWLRNKSNDTKNDGAVLAAIQSDVGYIKAGNDDIKRRIDDMSEQMVSMRERMTRVEASAKQAHKRLDRMEGALPRED